MTKLAIKSDNRKQNLLLPPSLDDLVPENHMVRVVDAVIDRLDISDILSTYRGGGNSAFSPKMMLKVLIFAYLSNVYSSRRIEELLKRDIYFMWLSGMKRPDFRTINYYRGKRLKNGFDSVFTQVVELLHEESFVLLKVQYIDGTKIESVANKYTFVWRGSVEKYDAKLKAKTEALLSQIEQNHAIETQENPVAEELTAEEVANRIERIKANPEQVDVLIKEHFHGITLDSSISEIFSESLSVKHNATFHHLCNDVIPSVLGSINILFYRICSFYCHTLFECGRVLFSW